MSPHRACRSAIPLSLAFSLALAVCNTASAAPPASHAHDHAHHGAHDRAAAAATAPATRWAVDASLREGMQRVRSALDDLRHHEMGHMSDGQAQERAGAIEEAVQFMFAHCRLAPEPDAALHSILVPLLSAAQRLKADSADKAEVAAMRDAIAAYPSLFDEARDAKEVPAHDGHAHDGHAH